MENRDFRVCPECDKMVDRNEMIWTYDCHGIPFRLVCLDCYEKVTETDMTANITTNAMSA